MRNAKISLPLALVALAAAMLVSASTATAADEKVANKDKKFITEAASGGMLEVRLGEYASKNATNQAVKDFGQQMVTDHSRANEQLMTLAQSKGVDVPKELDKKEQKTYDRLTKMSGADFDKAYMKEMVKDHEKDVKEFEKEAKDGKDEEIKKFASDNVETLRHHLEMARTTAESVGAGGGKTEGHGDNGNAGHGDHGKKDK
ncbi:MAG TPA: DUF4142 domain-containing protein [Tepidisphaeraceae bacterium]